MPTIRRYCPNCGAQLREVGDFRRFWLTVYVCPTNELDAFLHVADNRWIYPLQELQRGVLDALRVADDAKLELAVSRIKRIDYKTVSIVGFEHTLLGCYDPSRDYDVVYRSP
ncbi:MAG TPA: hypothetical protein VJZ00_17210 [Thermoanaerobaculia bacterium]|nr:hypothetical protein [Thermoanaerobaculia bacterium]